MTIKAVIFDLDGVLLSTDNFHYLAWKKLADKEDIYFDRDINERLRGVSRMESLAIVLEQQNRSYSEVEKFEMAEFKNDIYRDSLNDLKASDIFPGVLDFIQFLEHKKIKIAIGSSSKNAKFILEQIDLFETFIGAISDGTNITKSKPDPEVFLHAAEMIGIKPKNCLVIEDAGAGLEAAKAAGMMALGMGYVAGHKLADYSADDIAVIDRTIF
jgi:beta-phosphoglucomutase